MPQTTRIIRGIKSFHHATTLNRFKWQSAGSSNLPPHLHKAVLYFPTSNGRSPVRFRSPTFFPNLSVSPPFSYPTYCPSSISSDMIAPSTYIPVNGSIIPTSTSASGTPETITNIVFGLCALTIGGLTIWQGRKAWNMWMAYAAERAGAEEGMGIITETLIAHLGIKASRPPILLVHEKPRLTAFNSQIWKRHLTS